MLFFIRPLDGLWIRLNELMGLIWFRFLFAGNTMSMSLMMCLYMCTVMKIHDGHCLTFMFCPTWALLCVYEPQHKIILGV